LNRGVVCPNLPTVSVHSRYEPLGAVRAVLCMSFLSMDRRRMAMNAVARVTRSAGYSTGCTCAVRSRECQAAFGGTSATKANKSSVRSCARIMSESQRRSRQRRNPAERRARRRDLTEVVSYVRHQAESPRHDRDSPQILVGLRTALDSHDILHYVEKADTGSARDREPAG
jgi:hypothetical protein